MKQPAGLWIGGEWVRATGVDLPVTDPFTGEELTRVPLGDARTIDAALAAAEQAYGTTRALSRHERAETLLRVVRELEARRAQFVETIVREAGKPVIFAEAEFARAVLTFTVAAEEARREQGELLALDGYATGAGHTGLVRRFPIGVIAAISPFNFPLNLVAHKVAPCLATGNTMVVKCAPKTPLTALLLAETLEAAEVPRGQINVITCPNEIAGTVATDPRVAMLSFTGSGPVGWSLQQQCAGKKVVLELGGNAATIVHRDADLAAAVPLIAMAAFGYAGQSCISTQRVFVQEAVYEEFRERLVAQTREKIKTGDPRERETVVGPMISRAALERAHGMVRRAVEGGANVVHGGERRGPCLEPTILEDADPASAVCAEELFAPVVVLARYRDFDEAIAQVNASRYGLQASIFTRDLALAMKAYEGIDAGGVLVNEATAWRVEQMPYGGTKQSGFGREGLRYAMAEMTEPKVLVMKLG